MARPKRAPKRAAKRAARRPRREPAKPELPRGREELYKAVQENAVRALDWRKRNTTNLAIDRRIIKRGSTLLAHRQRIRVRADSVLVFADDDPRANWAHPCRYLLHDATSGELVDEIHAQFPPYLREIPTTYREYHVPVERITGDWYPLRPLFPCPRRVPKGERYAILFSGASNNRHTNDLEFLYRTLRHDYNFKPANITCLNYDGTINYSGGPHPVVAWPGDATAYQMPVNGAGTKAQLDAALDVLKPKLKPDDFLLIHTNNHGGWDGWGQAYLCTYSGADYYAADFGAKIGTLPPYHCLMVMMEQCHSGGFNAPIIANSTAMHTSVSSACLEDRNSIGGAHFDPFARDWIAAMAGSDPYGAALASDPDTNGDGRIGAREAHDYADSIHDPYDTPVFNSTSASARQCHLGRRYGWVYSWFCPWLDILLYPIWIRKPIPEFWEQFHEGIAPILDDIDDQLEKGADVTRSGLEARVKEAIARTYR